MENNVVSEWTVPKNSTAHEALRLIRISPKTGQELKKVLAYKGSFERFTAEVLNIMTNAHCANRHDSYFHITPHGEHVLMELGLVYKKKRNILNKITTQVYNSQEFAPWVSRPGADDHKKFPSRRGNRLYYRDGRVEDV